MKTRLDRVAIVLLVLLCAAWGINTVAIKLANEGIPPVFQAFLRSLLAALLVGLYAKWRGLPLFRIDASTLPGIAAGVLFGLEFIAFYVGVDGTTAARAVVFLYTMPFFVALGGAWLLPNERLGPIRATGLAVAFVGMAFGLFGAVDGESRGTLPADLLCIFAAMLWAATFIVIKATPLVHESAERILFHQLVWSVPALAVGAALAGPFRIVDATPMVLAALAYQVCVVVAVTYLVWFWLVRRYPAARLASFTFLTPLFGVVAGALILGDPVSPSFLLALTGVALGIWLVNRPEAA
ncbi:MAG: DMT family transporter [Pseudomonadota bacterium]